MTSAFVFLDIGDDDLLDIGDSNLLVIVLGGLIIVISDRDLSLTLPSNRNLLLSLSNQPRPLSLTIPDR